MADTQIKGLKLETVARDIYEVYNKRRPLMVQLPGVVRKHLGDIGFKSRSHFLIDNRGDSRDVSFNEQGDLGRTHSAQAIFSYTKGDSKLIAGYVLHVYPERYNEPLSLDQMEIQAKDPSQTIKLDDLKKFADAQAQIQEDYRTVSRYVAEFTRLHRERKRVNVQGFSDRKDLQDYLSVEKGH